MATVSSPIGTVGKGTYSLEVTQLASNQILTGPNYASGTETIGAGTLIFRFGQTSATSFTEDSATARLSIEIGPSATLNDVATAINTRNGGLTAYVAQTDLGAQLVIKGTDGAKKGFIIEATEDGTNPGLSNIAWQPGGDAARLLKTSADAEFLLDGIARRSPSNTIENIAPGLSLSLTATNAGVPATIGFRNSTSALSSAMQDITGALNEIVAELRTATDPMSGDLARDTGARALMRSFSALGTTVILPNAPEGSPRTLAELGLAIQRDGSFTFDSARMAELMTRDPAGVAAMFTTRIDGIYSTIERMSRSSSASGDPASLAGSIDRYQSQSQQIQTDLEKLAERQEKLRANMIARFAKADSNVAASKSTLTFLQSQIDAWNAQKN